MIKIDGDKNHVSQGTGISSKADIKGNKNEVYIYLQQLSTT